MLNNDVVGAIGVVSQQDGAAAKAGVDSLKQP